MTSPAMGEMQNTLLIIGAAVFFFFLVWKMRPSLSSEMSAEHERALRQALDHVRSAKEPRDKASALCDAAQAAVAAFPSSDRARSYLLRAMRIDSSWTEPVIVARKLLWKRDPVGLERFLWRVLGRVSWDDEHMPVVKEALETLASLYSRRLRDRFRAEALRKMLSRIP